MERSIEINWTNWKDVFDMAVEECVPKVVWKPKLERFYMNAILPELASPRHPFIREPSTLLL